MRKFILLAAAAICTLSLSAKTLYLAPGVWNTDGAKFAIYYFNNETDNGWSEFMSSADANTVKADIPDTYGSVIFVRLNGEASAPSWEAKWNQTEDLSLSGDNNLYTISDWGGEKSPGSWSVYGQGGGDNPGGGGDNPGGGSDTSDHYYYYKGWVDGADIETYMEGVNGFTKGKASFSCSSDSYIFIVYQVHGVQGVEFAWQGENAAEESESHQVTLVKSPSPFNKVHFAPGSYTLYLYEGDNSESLILATIELPGKKLVDSDGEGIENVVYTLDVNAPMFDLLGRQVNDNYHGVVIQNGHKFIR